MKLKNALLTGAAIILIGVICYSAYQLYDIGRSRTQEAEVRDSFMQYHPMSHLPTPESVTAESPTARVVNQSIADMRVKNPDIVGWVTVPNTKADYPFVQGADNEQYLHLDLNHRQSAAGSIFMDARNNPDFSDFNSIIYGHHMRNGSMFGSLQSFDNRAFFDDHTTGTIFLTNVTYDIEFMAFAIISPDDAVIYNTAISADSDKIAFLDHVATIARHYRDIGAAPGDRIVTLSTCSYEFDNARLVLIGRINERAQ